MRSLFETIVVGSKDIKHQPKRPAHIGNARIDIAYSWADKMNQNAKNYGMNEYVGVHVIPNIGHSSSALTPYCAEVLFGVSGL